MADNNSEAQAKLKELVVSQKLYSLDAVLTAAYVFIDRAYVFLDYDTDGNIKITLRCKPETTAEEFAGIEGNFQNELLHQSIRVRLGKKNRIREIIIGQALFSLNPGDASAMRDEPDEEVEKELKEILAESGEDDLDYLEDPLEIAIPWEEKQKKAQEKEKKAGQND